LSAILLTLRRVQPRDLVEITKPRLSSMVLISAIVGMVLAPAGLPVWWRALLMLVGTAGAVGGANALNSYWERDLDALMRRTRTRPLPSGRLDPSTALIFGSLISVAGTLVLWAVHPVASILAMIAITSYVFVYTPLKRRSSLNTIVGAVPGAIPPMIGWVVATGSLDAGAWLLFAWLFLWQPPHFLSLAMLYREDYEAAGFPMLTVSHAETGMVERQMVLYTSVLILVPMLLVPFTSAGVLTLIAAPLLGLGYLATVLREWIAGTTRATARASFSASILYLGVVMLVMVVDVGTKSRLW
jgi:protoheme IX farnesyltransferase